MITKSLFTIFSFFVLSLPCNAQLDSISVSTNFSSTVDPYDSTSTIDLLNIDVWFNDKLNVGGLEVFVLDSANMTPYGYATYDSVAIYSASLIDSLGHMIVVIENIKSTESWVLKILTQNSDMFFLKEEVIELSGI